MLIDKERDISLVQLALSITMTTIINILKYFISGNQKGQIRIIQQNRNGIQIGLQTIKSEKAAHFRVTVNILFSFVLCCAYFVYCDE